MSFKEKIIFNQLELKEKLHQKANLVQKIVFTNGCFDLIHAGHIHLLSTARSFGDVLIVGLNTDASVSQLKPGRPLQDEATRALIMASFTVTDAVVLFNEETPLELITSLRPDVLVKGGDYTKATVVGSDLVESYGGNVELVNLLEGFSTSGIIGRMKSGGG